MSQAAPVVCAGVVVADHVCTPIQHLPRAGELVAADDLFLSVGGCASNAAVDLSKLGFRSRICGRVGADALGRFLRESLDSHNIDTRGLTTDPELSTSQTLIVNVRGEDRRFVHAFGANGSFSVDDIDSALEPRPAVFYLGGYLIMQALDPALLADRFARLRAQGTITVLDVATPGRGDYLPLLRPVLPHVDVFLPNSDEAELILGERDPVRQAEGFRALGARRVVITMGDEGAVAVSDSMRVRLGVFPMPFVDGSGGGDAFDAGYIAGLLENRDELGCLTLASVIGASCVRAVGTTAGVFTKAEAEEFLLKHSLPIRSI
jgi:sugar/nucleoside kinase (ribokinase family)